MQFTMLSAFAALALATLAAATPTVSGSARRNDVPPPPPPPANQCNSGSLQCCDSTQDATNPTSAVLGLLTLLGVDLGSITALIGLTCSPITGVGISGDSCSQQSVCCTDNKFNGLVALGCTPINLNL